MCIRDRPLAICDRIVKHFSNINDLILIPFGGSGSECVSAISNSRNFIAFEKNKDYIKIANQRLSDLKVNQQIELEIKTNSIFVET